MKGNLNNFLFASTLAVSLIAGCGGYGSYDYPNSPDRVVYFQTYERHDEHRDYDRNGRRFRREEHRNERRDIPQRQYHHSPGGHQGGSHHGHR